MSTKATGLIVDCSFIMSILLPDETSDRSQEILMSGRFIPLVPALWLIEVSNVLLTSVKRKRISNEIMGLLVQNIKGLEVQVDKHQQSIEKIVSLAEEFGLTAYDAVYLELALRTSFPIATHDLALKTAAQKAGIAIIS